MIDTFDVVFIYFAYFSLIQFNLKNSTCFSPSRLLSISLSIFDCIAFKLLFSNVVECSFPHTPCCMLSALHATHASQDPLVPSSFGPWPLGLQLEPITAARGASVERPRKLSVPHLLPLDAAPDFISLAAPSLTAGSLDCLLICLLTATLLFALCTHHDSTTDDFGLRSLHLTLDDLVNLFFLLYEYPYPSAHHVDRRRAQGARQQGHCGQEL